MSTINTDYSEKRIKTEDPTTVSSNTSINDLPSNVIEMIFKAVRPEDLYSCSLVNRRFSAELERVKNSSLGETFFEYRFPDMYALMKKEGHTPNNYPYIPNDYPDTPNNYRCENYNRLAKEYWRELLDGCDGGYWLEVKHQAPIIKFFKANDNTGFASLDSSDTVFFWNRWGKCLGSFYDGTFIRKIEIIEKLIYIIGFQELLIFAFKDNESGISEKLKIVPGGFNFLTGMSDIGLFTVLRSGQVNVYMNFVEYPLTLPEELGTFNHRLPFNIVRVYKNYIVIIKENRINLLEIALQKSEETDEQSPFLKRIELKENLIRENGAGSTTDNPTDYPNNWITFSENKMYYHANWQTDCWDLKTGGKLASLPESITPPIIAHGRIVLCYKNTMSILNEETQRCIHTEYLHPENVQLLQEATCNRGADVGFKDICCIDGLITSSKFTISLFVDKYGKTTRFVNHNSDLDFQISLKTVFPVREEFIVKVTDPCEIVHEWHEGFLSNTRPTKPF